MCEIFCVRGPCATGEQTFGVALYEGSDEEICRYTECVSNEASNDLTEKDIMLVAGTITGYCCGSPNLRPRVQHQIPHSNRPTSLVNEEYIADGRGKECK